MGSPQLEEELFATALAFPADERIPFLERACACDSKLLSRLRQLVATASKSTCFVKEQQSPIRTASDSESIGYYRMLQQLGEGSCGSVFLAEQTAPVRRHVALKILKLSTDARSVLARFEVERQALALMDHPGIAKVLDVGTTAAGQPYFAMEWIRGVKITEYCDLARLSIPERVRLFTQVCLATQHAHSQGVIHRDIKPSNVLVTLQDGEPVAKIIDFSIAKAISGPLTDRTLQTAVGQFVGTPEYMSPEQLDPLGSVADTRSDVYSLGALLYELLTGHTPFGREDLLKDGFEQMRTRIREHDPVRPSKRVATFQLEELQRASSQRRCPPAKLSQQLRGDLDWIVLQCVEKDASRRYQTASELGVDLRRYLSNQPVLARPPSVLYSLRKFGRRHRAVFAAGATGLLLVALLIVFAITVSIQNRRIAAERDRAERDRLTTLQVSESLLGVIGTSDPFESGGRPVTAPELLDRIAKDVRTDLHDDSDARARLLEAIGRAYRRMGQLDDASTYLTDAARIRRRLEAPAPLAESLVQVGTTLSMQGRYQEAERALNEAETLLEGIGQKRSIGYARLLLSRGRLQSSMSAAQPAERSLRESLALRTALLGSHHPDTAVAWLQLGQALLWNDDAVGAEHSTRQALTILERTVPSTHPERAQAYVALADALYVQRRYDEAIPLLEKALSMHRSIFGERDRHTAYVLDSLATLRLAQGQTEEAQNLARQALAAISSTPHENGNPETVYHRITLANALLAGRKYTEAEQLLSTALQLLTSKHGPNHQHTASAEHYLAEVLLATDRPREAEAIFRSSINRWKLSGAPAWRVARSENGLAQALYLQGRTDEAEPLLVETYRILAVTQAADPSSQKNARERLVRFYTERGQRDRLDAALALPTSASAGLH